MTTAAARDPRQMTDAEIKNEMEHLRYDVRILNKEQEARYFALDDERHTRR